MKLKPLIISLVVLAILSGTAYFLTRHTPPPPRDPRVGQPLLTADSVNSASQFRLTDGGKTILLKRQPDATWQVSGYYDFPANFSKLASLIRSLTNAKIQRFVTDKPERFSRLDFKDTSIALIDDNDTPFWSVSLGKTSGSGGRFVHFGDETKAYLVNFNAWLDTTPKNWADSTLINLKAEDIAKVELTFPESAPVIAQRSKPNDPFKSTDAPDGHQLKTTRITTLLRSLTPLRFTDTTEPDSPEALAAAESSRRTVTLSTFDGVTFTIDFRRKPESRKSKSTSSLTEEIADTDPLEDTSATDQADEPAKPEYETIPAGPVFVHISSSDSTPNLETLMAKRAFKVSDYLFTSLPPARDALFEPLKSTE